MRYRLFKKSIRFFCLRIGLLHAASNRSTLKIKEEGSKIDLYGLERVMEEEQSSGNPTL